MNAFKEKVEEQFILVEEFKKQWIRKALTIDIARQIVNLIYQNRWSQKEVADELGIEKETIDQIVRLEPLPMEKLKQVADKLRRITT